MNISVSFVRRFVVLLALFSFFLILFYERHFNRGYVTNISTGKQKRLVDQSSAAVGCVIPKVNPYHKQALEEMEDLKPLDCNKKNIATTNDGHMNIAVNGVIYLHLQYIRRAENDDFSFTYSDPLHITDFKVDSIQTGNIGCLVNYRGNRIFQFDSDDNVIKADTCVPDGLFEITANGRISTLEGKCLASEDDCRSRCPLVLSFDCEDENSKFRFEPNGIIRHLSTGACVKMMSDIYGDYTELLLSFNCAQNSTRWHMYQFYETDIKTEVSMTEDFARLVYVRNKKVYFEYHASVPLAKKERENYNVNRRDGKDLYNILLIVLESQSKANMLRKMKETYKYLSEDKNTFVFNGHTIVGDGTTDQMCAILTGKLEEELPETRRNMDNSVFLDEWPMTFDNFSRRGYRTLFSEDGYDFGTFNYRLNGFKKPPTDHYSRIFWSAAKQESDNNECIGARPHHRISLDYTTSFFKQYIDRPKLALTMLTYISHNNMNGIQHVDKDMVGFLEGLKQSGFLKDSFLFIFGDHGLRTSSFRATVEGSLEERLPFFSLTLPERFQTRHPKLKEIIARNTDVLTSHFDIHATLSHILHYPKVRANETGQSLLTLINGETRTCHSAGVKNHWCPCLRFTEISTHNELVTELAKKTVEFINRVKNSTSDSELKCANLELDNVTYAGVTEHVSEAFESMSFANDYLIQLSDEPSEVENLKPKSYRLILTVKPSGGMYEASIYKDGENGVHIDPEISRINLYGSQPKCIAEKYPHLRKFCFCK